jgi:Protein of unknown function (DUF3237)
MNPPGLEFLFTLTAEVGDILTMGAAPLGERRVVQITGGTSRARRCAAR